MFDLNYNHKYASTDMLYADEKIEYVFLKNNISYFKWMGFTIARSQFGYDGLRKKYSWKCLQKEFKNNKKCEQLCQHCKLLDTK